ncbi:MAG: dinB [Chloroflexi bacterium]|nr:dinB [Chloroflexota bacterium]
MARPPARHHTGVSGTTILHVDLDAFFAAVEQRDRPELRGRPVIVGGAPGSRGVVSAASYEARRFGVRSAMPLRTAAALCPDGVFVPVNGRKYRHASGLVMDILRRFTPRIEQISIDEAFLDVAGSEALFGPPPTIAVAIKEAVRAEVGLTVSVGVASTKLVAKVASDLRKPDGLVVVPAGQEAAFLAPLPISRLWGVGPQTQAVLAELGADTIGELAAMPVDALVRRLGQHGAELHDRALGIDPSPVSGDVAAKSVSHEHTFSTDTTDQEKIEATILALAEGVAERLRHGGVRASTVTVKVRDSTFRTVTRQRRLAIPTDLAEPIYRTALELARPEIRGRRIRLVGVAGSGLEEPAQLALFAEEDPRRRRVAEAADSIRSRFGRRSVTRARLLRSHLAAPEERDPMQPLERRRLGAAPAGSASPGPAPRDARPGGAGGEPGRADEASQGAGMDEADDARGPDDRLERDEELEGDEGLETDD